MKRLLPFLKDRTEGTGTLTYVDPDKGTYGALGHQIIDSALKSPPSLEQERFIFRKSVKLKKVYPEFQVIKFQQLSMMMIFWDDSDKWHLWHFRIVEQRL